MSAVNDVQLEALQNVMQSWYLTNYTLISILCMQVCVPIDPENAENFDPVDGVPTVSQLLTDLDQSDIKQSTADMQVSRTSMSSGQVHMQNMGTVMSKARWSRSHDMHFRPVSNL